MNRIKVWPHMTIVAVVVALRRRTRRRVLDEERANSLC